MHIELTGCAGTFLSENGWLATVRPASRMNDGLAESVRAAVLVGTLRTPTQDIRFSMRHLIDVALRALSPGINDANTAMVVIDRMQGAMSKVLSRELPPGEWTDRDGVLRVSVPCPGYGELLDYAFDQIRRAASGHPAVALRILQALARIAEHATLAEQTSALSRQARLVEQATLKGSLAEDDREQVHAELERVMKKLEPLARVSAAPERTSAASGLTR